MSRVLDRLKEEFLLALPAAIFFVLAFHLIAVTRSLLLEDYGIRATHTLFATAGALVIAKVVLLVEKLRFVNLRGDRPLVYNVLWKTLLFALFALLVRILEHLLPQLYEHRSFGVAARSFWRAVDWPDFWAIQIWVAVLLFAYCAAVELVRAVGHREVTRIFFGRRQATSD